jgi:hypothetical protein
VPLRHESLDLLAYFVVDSGKPDAKSNARLRGDDFSGKSQRFLRGANQVDFYNLAD